MRGGTLEPEQPVGYGIAGEVQGQDRRSGLRAGILDSWLCSLGQVLSPSELRFIIVVASRDCLSAVHEGLPFCIFIQKIFIKYLQCAIDAVLGTGATVVDKGPSLWPSHSSGCDRQLST